MKLSPSMDIDIQMVATVTDKNGKVVQEVRRKNITATVGREDLAARLVDLANTTDLGVAKYGAVGTGLTSPIESDTQLSAETHRVAIVAEHCTSVGNVATIVFTFSGSWTGTSYEAGIFMGASATAVADTGRLLVRSLFPSGLAKTDPSHNLTVSWTVTLTDI